ncbi:MAG TPA: site-specific integrase [Gemmatimonadaceae bacterium]|nr:site-specific integrase [Gemmatimonadaceae bacterium]
MSETAKVLASYGPKGSRVRVILHDEATVRAEWYEGPKGAKRRRVKEWPATGAGKAEAKAWAKMFSEARTLPAAPDRATLRTLFERYARAEFEHLRPATQRLYSEHWRYWERMWGREFEAERTTLDMVDEFRVALTKRGLSVTLIGKAITTIKQVYRWGRMRGHLPSNPIGDYRYKVAKDKRPKPVPEYSDAEFRAIMATYDPADGRTWRAYVGLSLCGWQGVRENAAVHLQWADIDWDGNLITWRARYDKMGREWTQPMRSQTREALATAKFHRERLGYTGPWVLMGGNSLSKRDGSYSPDALIKCLRTAEKRARVKYIKGRGPHGLRRLLAGDVHAATGNAVLAMRSIGDTDIRMANRYILERDEEVRAAFDAVDKRRNGATAIDTGEVSDE